MLSESALLQKKWVKVAPHIIDTLLLGSAIALAITLQISPFEQTWLLAKIIGLLLYIALGTVALKRGKTRQIRMTALILALLTFGYIVKVALTKSPLLF